MKRRPTVEITEDGSATLRTPLGDVTYHSTRGAVGESRHVFIGNGLLQTGCDPVRILEAGFGTGLNAWLTYLEAARQGRAVEYTAVEFYPVPAEVVAQLNYTDDPRFTAMHAAKWDARTAISDSFNLHKVRADLAVMDFSGSFDLVYYDAFAPDTQPELWTEEIFSKIYSAMSDGGILVTYSAKGDVKRVLRSAGFIIERLPGALGKHHMLRARKPSIAYASSTAEARMPSAGWRG